MVHQRWQDVQRYLALQRQAFTLITAPEVRPVVLRSPKAESQARGVLLLKPESQTPCSSCKTSPPLAQDWAYQLWLGFGDRQRDDGGVFRVDEQGFGVIPVTAPRPFTAYQE